jgi:hypothetical protein
MNEEYEQIRRGLLALLCAGDSINCIISTGISPQVRKYYVYDIIHDPETICFFDDFTYYHEFPFKMFEMYKGELYFWNDTDNRSIFIYRTPERIERITKILESASTEYYL